MNEPNGFRTNLLPKCSIWGSYLVPMTLPRHPQSRDVESSHCLSNNHPSTPRKPENGHRITLGETSPSPRSLPKETEGPVNPLNIHRFPPSKRQVHVPNKDDQDSLHTEEIKSAATDRLRAVTPQQSLPAGTEPAGPGRTRPTAAGRRHRPDPQAGLLPGA
ncbi:hypothetical protein P7K49_004393 [Saguinus oedipus]|uniref:Uncharacterized protein n=1 Tax=Saguinus oedipus TaxID=9490 RepID=A0ABQ9W7A0_SAGOE|nr:hypothetical protein P7K49_004393 [Saguinus oedipus]